ncbi:hypothetical protein O181_111008 [Austropuccinia psidii MF-1]|uniref:Uncharacterized protein n=1 Tax=Austropuccinia psidii MF-1 TaxID=1389203 RepID=A0A9Q3PRC0_9BASI|nr:hypothetical protein [Austropuccinia psidii MF-1]
MISIAHYITTSKITLVNYKNLGIPKNQPEDIEGLSRTRRPGRGHLGHSGGWKETEGNNTHSVIHLQIQQKPETRGLEGYGAVSSAPPIPQISFPKEHGQQDVQPSIKLARTWSKLPEDMSQSDILQRRYHNHQRMESHQAVQTPEGEGNKDKEESCQYPSYRRTDELNRAYSYSFRLTRNRPTKLLSAFTPFSNQQISGHDSSFFTIQGSFQQKTRIQGQKNTSFSQGQKESKPKIQKLLVSACDSKPEHKHDSQNTINQWYSQNTTKTWS